MRSLFPKLLAPLAVCVALLALAASASAAPAVTGAFTLKSPLGGNNKIAQGPEGNIWVTLSDENEDVAKVTPAGTFEEFDLGEEVKEPGGIVAAAGKLWVPTKENGIVSFLPSNPKSMTKFEIPGLETSSSLALGADGDIWAVAEKEVFRLPPGNPEAGKTPIAVPELSAPKDVDAAGSLIAIADGNMEEARIVTFTTGAIPVEKVFAINGGSQGVAGSPNGQIGFSEQVPKGKQAEEIGVITPPNPAFSLKQPDDPFGAAFGSDGAFWIVRAGGPHGLARLTPAGQLTLLGGFPAETTPRQITSGPNNTLWVTAEGPPMKPGVLIRISGLEPPVTTPLPGPTPAPLPIVPGRPQTTLGKGPKGLVETTKAKVVVKFTFSADVTGAAFQCALTKGQKTKKGKLRFAKPKFQGCKSPRSYRVGVGSYRFQVRAMSAGGVDSTPAKRSFRVVRKPK